MVDHALSALAIGPKVNRFVAIASALLALLIVVGVAIVYLFVESERERELQSWQVRLGIVADSRAAAVEDWISAQFAALRDLAENASLQLYMTEVALSRSGQSDFNVDDVEVAYLRNLLVATANRAGFTAPEHGATVNANVERVGLAGLALTDPQGEMIVATPAMPPPSPFIRQAMARAAAGEAALADVHIAASGEPTIAMVIPVYAIQEDAGASKAIGLIVGVKVVNRDLFTLLAQPGETLETAQSYLVRADRSSIEYLSPLADGTQPLRRTLARDTPNLAAAFVAETPGGFAVKRDYAGKSVLVTGRKLSGAPWHLVRTVGRDEALAEIDGRAATMYVVFVGLIAVMAVSLVAVWRHGTSLRAAEAAERYRVSADRFQGLSRFLRVVTDGQPTAIAAIDGDGHYSFANKAAALQAGTTSDDMLGKTMTSVIGPAKAKLLDRYNQTALRDGERVSAVHEFDENDGVHVVKSDHIPLADESEGSRGVLMVLEDITELTRERRRRERTLKSLIETLVGVVDRRDPYSANHSVRVAEIARAMGDEMGLDGPELEAVEIAGNLLNLGKILVPSELLTKVENLTDEERAVLRDSALVSAELVRGVDFNAPVVPYLEQVHERWDGTGPKQVAGDDILLGARILAVANAFVGMVSARAYRAAIPIDRACQNLLDQAGSAFDRRPVSALANIVDNRGGRERWAHFGEPPAEPGA